MVQTEEAIAYAEICVYVPVLILTLIVVVRHGFKKQLGWIYLAVFCVIRIAGAGFKIDESRSPNKTNTEWSGILQSVGLSPLLMASLGLLKRVYVASHFYREARLIIGAGPTKFPTTFGLRAILIRLLGPVELLA